MINQRGVTLVFTAFQNKLLPLQSNSKITHHAELF